MKLNWVVVAVVGSIIVLALWLLTPLIAGLFSVWLGDGVSLLGPAGDVFGVVSALFNGFAFLAIIVVLVYEMGERRKDLDEVNRLSAERVREMRPFIVPAAVPDGFRLARAEWDQHEYVCEISAEFALSNATSDVAIKIAAYTSLEPATKGGASSAAASVDSRVDLPLSGLASHVIHPTFQFRGDSATTVLRSLSSREAIDLQVRVDYSSLNGASWDSVVTYRIELDGDGPERVGYILSKNEDYYVKSSAGGRPIVFNAFAAPDSWSQGER